MKESRRIENLFAKQYNGDPWLGVNMVDKLGQINPEQAAYKFSPEANSIWELLNHIIGWREAVLHGIPQKSYLSPIHNYIQPITNPSQEEWIKTLDRLKKTQTKWIQFLSTVEETIFDEPFGDKSYSHYELIMGVLHHDIYHLGQISLLVRLIDLRK
ncbi:DinB family protein [Algoriphagus sp. D3-2-R+10]|uniref:DinB family protein n=1 Tax=Algoriphagus aurantiacus TaxID=3103948 RepID=UPI002B3D02E0|nr:DinB family protein [Algoriphagus sp. D3-2-R+10]MEB2775485.1 DinB family protein [Algoriphagus sp. D3-2-R+10]